MKDQTSKVNAKADLGLRKLTRKEMRASGGGSIGRWKTCGDDGWVRKKFLFITTDKISCHQSPADEEF